MNNLMHVSPHIGLHLLLGGSSGKKKNLNFDAYCQIIFRDIVLTYIFMISACKYFYPTNTGVSVILIFANVLDHTKKSPLSLFSFI